MCHREMRPLHTELSGPIGGPPMEAEHRAAVFVVDNLQLLPADPAGLVGPREGLEGGLLGRKPNGDVGRGIAHPLAVGRFVRRKQPRHERLCSATGEHVTHTLVVHDVDADSQDHLRCNET